MTIQGVRDALANHLPAGRTVREIHGALVDPDATQLTHPKDSIVLSSDAEVEAFFRITESKPIKLLIVMHRKVEDGADTPPHAGSGQVHFAKNHFDPPKVYDDPATDSDSLVRTWAGFKKRRMPKKDQSFEERIMKIRRKIKQLQKVKRELKAEHKRQYPTALDSDDEGWHYLDWLRPRLDAATWVSPMARTAAQVGVDAFHACDSSGLTAIESQYAAMSSAAMALDRSAPPMRKGMVAATVQGGLNHCLTLTPALKVHDAPGRRWKEDDDEDPVE
ncbi:hypothetical protein BDZ91DRAFT_730817 [Kalaharituber pfeilii]|nr:hypothetical protein BDZ91DRAFT_730817 [Kalaharituber pfeilii]